MRMIVLMGLPGSGKTTLALEHFKDCVRVNQDELGSRDACVAKAKEAIEAGKDVLIDRTNISIRQRRTWVNLAKYYDIKEIECIHVSTGPLECFERMLKRKGHPTIKNELEPMEKRAIIKKFDKDYEPPSYAEGFTKVIVWDL